MFKYTEGAVPPVSLLFETSWEVCNKIGGIYTVLSTKAKVLDELYPKKTIFIGPDVWSEESPSPYFKEDKSLISKSQLESLDLPHGIKIRVGRWEIESNPIAVLVSFDGVYESLPGYFAKMWEEFKVDSLHSYGDYSEGCSFAIAAAHVISALTPIFNKENGKVVAHFDEWTTGMGLLLTRLIEPQIATVFTTHATSIGRSICGNNKPLYDYFDGYNGDQMASELNMESKHSLEKAAAHFADAFTTVSDVTKKECVQLLECPNTFVTPNGFEPNFVPAADVRKKQRTAARKKLLAVASALTGKKLSSTSTFIVATSGRNEYRNKGIDLYIDAINSLRGSKCGEEKQILALILVPAWVKEAREDLKSKSAKENGALPQPWLAHHLNNEDYDSINCRLRDINANGDSNDKVTFLYLPVYLDGKDGIVDISYYSLLPGLDLTVFPSYYEPWGYTPLESVAFGVPTVTTDKAGFGQWVDDTFTSKGLTGCGCEVVARNDSNYGEAAAAIAEAVKQARDFSAAKVKAASAAALATAQKADWRNFIKYYNEAYGKALENAECRTKSSK